MSSCDVLLHLLERFEVDAAEPATVAEEEAGVGVFGVDCGVLFHEVHLLMFDKVATVGALPPGGVLVELPVGAEVFLGVALGAAFGAGVMVAVKGLIFGRRGLGLEEIGGLWDDRNVWKLVRWIEVVLGVGRLSGLVQLVDDDSVLVLEMGYELLGVSEADSALLAHVG